MKTIIKRPLSIILAALMVISLFAAVPMTAGAVDKFDVRVFKKSIFTDPNNPSIEDMTDFVDVDDDAAKAWDGAPSDGLSFLIYGFDSSTDKFKVASFRDGTNYSISECTFAECFYLSDGMAASSVYYTVPLTHTITWMNYDGTVLATEEVVDGDTPAYNGDTPVMDADARYTYTHKGWSPAVTAATENATYIATYKGEPNPSGANVRAGMKWYKGWYYSSWNGGDGGYFNNSLSSDHCFMDDELINIKGPTSEDNYWRFYFKGQRDTNHIAIKDTVSGMTPTGLQIVSGSGTRWDRFTVKALYGPAPDVDLESISLAPNYDASFVVDRVIPMTVSFEPRFTAAGKTIKWSVDSDNVALYTDKDCTTPVGNEATDAVTVYAKGEDEGNATVTAVCAQDESITASYDITVQESDPNIGLQWFPGQQHDLYDARCALASDPTETFDIDYFTLYSIDNYNDSKWRFTFKDFIFHYNDKIIDFDITENTPTGVEIVSGAGAEEDPYIIDLTYDEAPYVAVSSIGFTTDSSQKVYDDGSIAITAGINPKYATNKKVTWSVNNANVSLYTDAECTIPVGSGETDALTVYAKGDTVGTANVTVTSADNNTKSATCSIEVLDSTKRMPVNYQVADTDNDGWNGNQINVCEKGTNNIVAVIVNDEFKPQSGAVNLVKGKSYDLVWVKKGYHADECSFSIVDPYTGETFSAETSDCAGFADGQVIYTITAPPYDYTIGTTGYYFADTIKKGVDDTLAQANGYSNLYNFKILGVQKKYTDSNGTEETRGVRFVAVLNNEILQDAEDYGFIAVAGNYMSEARANIDGVTLDTASDKNVFTCKGTNNSISGEYGKYNSQKDYKYVTFAINNIRDKGVAVMFYLKDRNNKVYYANYTNREGATYTNCAVDWATLSKM